MAFGTPLFGEAIDRSGQMLGCATGRICCRCHLLSSSCLTWVIGLAATMALVHMMLDYTVKELSIAST